MSSAATKNPAWIRAAIAAGNRFHYKKKNPFRHNAINLLTLATLLGAVVAILLAGDRVHPLLYVPAAALALGLLYFALIVLVSHEGAHGMFIVSKKAGRARFWNRFFGWGVSLFFAMHFVEGWERGHHEHHLHPIESTDDPFYAVLPLGRDLLRETTKMALIPAYMLLRERPAHQPHQPAVRREPSPPSKRAVLAVTASLWAGILTLTWLKVGWAAPVAALLGLQVASAIDVLKLALEHGGAVGREDNRFLRARTTLFPLRRFLLPLNISLHFEHHLNYCVPWYDLPRYHRALLEIVPRQVQPYVFNRDVWGQLSGRKGGVPPALAGHP